MKMPVTALRSCLWLKAFALILLAGSCSNSATMKMEVYETSASGHQLSLLSSFETADTVVEVALQPAEKYQTITGFGGAFTEASASVLNKLSAENRRKVLEAYFGPSGARYSLTRTHMNSCDFSLGNYSYAPVKDDRLLSSFTISEDMDDIVPMIKDAMAVSKEGFRIIASPWTAPPWMKDNNNWRGGRLLPQYYDTWALFFSKYLEAYKAEGIDIWGFTIENEPLGNGNNWESMLFTPGEMNAFVVNHLRPLLTEHKHAVKLLGYDQNRGDELKEWADAMYDDTAAASAFDGIALHWYASTFEYFPEMLQYVHNKAPGKYMIQTEACIDAEVPVWKNDAWYWREEATDWGWDWAPENQKYLHPKYAPVNRYANDIIGCLNNWVDGWIDWNMVLDTQGGPNWAKNWCIAPVIANPATDEVYFTPLYYTMAHFSRFIRPGAVRIGCTSASTGLKATAAQNPDGSIALVLFNPGEKPAGIHLTLQGQEQSFAIAGKAIQTVIIPNQTPKPSGN